jgi:hypothetical protein
MDCGWFRCPVSADQALVEQAAEVNRFCYLCIAEV